MRVIGTAGHVDHGKSTLIAALTGVHPDRLKEERAREMTIDLGFGWLTLPDGETVGIVDVPGHRDFIENMLAGVGGIDAALFVIAADEGIMPQTREHLAILDLLQVQSGVVAMTKIDLVDDPEWLDLVEADIHQALRGTSLENAPLVRVSARTRQGLEELLQALSAVLERSPERLDLHRPRLPVDRVFTMPGFGTVVTGTLADGRLHLGDEIEILPGGQRGRVRGLQTHRQKEEVAVPGSRTAVNLAGVDLEGVKRGDVISLPNTYRATRWLDVSFRLLPDAAAPLKHNSEVKLFIGASEEVARVRVLGSEELQAGESGWLQLELRELVVAVRGDRYILRRPSPGETLGGGVIVNPQPGERHKRFSPEVLQELEALTRGAPSEILMQAILASGIVAVREAVAQAQLGAEQAAQALSELIESGQALFLEEGDWSRPQSSRLLIVSQQQWGADSGRALQIVQTYQRNYPLRKGIPREELKSRLGLATHAFNAFLGKCVSTGILAEAGAFLQTPEFRVRFSPQQQAQVDELLERFARSPYSPPAIKECQQALGGRSSTPWLTRNKWWPSRRRWSFGGRITSTC